MMESSSSANYTPHSLLRNRHSKLYNWPGFGDTEERKKASEAPKLLQRQRKRETVTRIRQVLEVLTLLLVVIWVITTTSSEDWRQLKIFNLATSPWKTFAVTIVIGRLLSYFLMWIIVKVNLKVCGTRTKPYLLHAIDSTLTCVLWFGIVFVAWEFIVDYDLEIEEKQRATFTNLAKGMSIMVVGALFWLFKILWLKTQTITFIGDRFFDDIKTVLFCHFIIRSIILRNGSVTFVGGGETIDEITVGEFGKQKGKKELWHQLPFEEWRTLNHYTIPAATLSLFAKIIRYTTLDNELEGLVISDELGNSNSRTLNGHTAKVLADKIFDLVVGRDAMSIKLYDLERWMPKSMAQEAMKEITRSSTISRADLRRWLVTNFRKWRKLEINLSNNHAVMKSCNFILNCAVLVITISWAFFIMNSSATKDFFVVLLTQSAILVVLLKDTVKKYSDCIRFFFHKHPIGVGDICWIEGDWMIVQDVKLLHSKFISENNVTLELENTYLLQQRIHVARDEDVWRQHDDDIVSSSVRPYRG